MRDWKNIFEELAAPFAAEELKDLTEELGGRGKAKPYAPIETYIKRLGDDLGQDGFRIEYENPQLHSLPRADGAVPVWSVNCKLSLLDENGRYHCSTTCPGTAVVQGTSDANVPTALRKARADALKACCSIYEIGGDVSAIWESANGRKRQPDSRPQQYPKPADKAERKTGSQTPPQAAAGTAAQKQEAVTLQLKPAGKFAEGRNGTFYVPVTTSEGGKAELWFYREYVDTLMSTPSKCKLSSRFDDLRSKWPESGAEIPVLINYAAGNSSKLYFRGLA